MQLVALCSVLKHARVCLTIKFLIKTLSEFLCSLCYFLVDFIVEFCDFVLDKHIGTIALLRVAVVDQRVVERIDVSGSLPDCRVHEYS